MMNGAMWNQMKMKVEEQELRNHEDEMKLASNNSYVVYMISGLLG
jgi:hypothetical protein